MANLLELTNRVLVDTGIGKPVSTVQGMAVDSIVGRVVKALRDGQKRASAKMPNAALRFRGSIRTADDLEIPTDSDGQTLTYNNGNSQVTLVQTTGDAATTAISDYEDAHGSTIGKLLVKKSENTTYRIGARKFTATPTDRVDFNLYDHGGNEAKYPGTTDTAATATIAQDRYLLPSNFKAPLGSWVDFFGADTLEYKPPELFDLEILKDRDSPFTLGSPWLFTIRTSQLASGRPQFFVEFFPVPDDVYQYPFTYEGSPTLMYGDEDVSGWQDEYEMAIESYAKWHAYKYIKGDLEQAQDERANWTEIIGDQIKSPLTSMEAVQVVPASQREHWDSAYDV